MVKFLRLFKELWLIVSGVAASVKTIVWVSFLLLIVLYIAGIFVTLSVGRVEEGYDYQDRDFAMVSFYCGIFVPRFWYLFAPALDTRSERYHSRFRKPPM